MSRAGAICSLNPNRFGSYLMCRADVWLAGYLVKGQVTLVKRQTLIHVFGRGFDSRRVHQRAWNRKHSGGPVTASTGTEGWELTSRVVWPPIPDTQTKHANKAVVASKANVVSFPTKSVAPAFALAA